MIFRVTNWYVLVSHLVDIYKDIRALMRDPDLKDQFLQKKIDRLNAIERVKIVWDEDNTALFKEMQGLSLPRALEFFERQIVVAISTYIELVLKEFFSLVFKQNPERMYNYVNLDEARKGYINVKQVLRASTIDEILDELAEQAAAPSRAESSRPI